MERKVKLYHAIRWSQRQDSVGVRVNVWAQTLTEARRKLGADYGDENVYNLHNAEDANKPR
jgi:hypothetical protein